MAVIVGMKLGRTRVWVPGNTGGLGANGATSFETLAAVRQEKEVPDAAGPSLNFQGFSYLSAAHARNSDLCRFENTLNVRADNRSQVLFAFSRLVQRK
ncbi:MAG: hypothetical protein JSR99_10675 [Proteobacteria bacterium]|nr:hypothetical protein [Pseudomonadota bacterium]